MPWILIPFLFLFSFNIHFTDDIAQTIIPNTTLFLIPLSIFLGLKYQQRGVLVLGIGLFMLFQPFNIDSFINITDEFNLFYLNGYISHISIYNNIGLYILLLILSSISAYYPDFFKKYKNSAYFSKHHLLIFLILGISFHLSNDMLLIYLNLIAFIYLYVFTLALSSKYIKLFDVVVISFFLFLLNFLFFPNKFSTNDELTFYYNYNSLDILLTIISMYFLGKVYQKSLSKKIDRLFIKDYFYLVFIILPILTISFIFEIKEFEYSIKNYFLIFMGLYLLLRYIIEKKLNKFDYLLSILFILPIALFSSGDISIIEPIIVPVVDLIEKESIIVKHTYNAFLFMATGLYLGIKYKKIGILFSIILLLISLFINIYYEFRTSDILIEIENLKIVPLLYLKYYIYLLFFVFIGYLSTKMEKTFTDYNKQLITSSNAKIIYRLWLFIILFFPILTIIGVFINIDGDITQLQYILSEMKKSNTLLIIFIFTIIYLLFIYIPILITEGIIRRNGVIFNVENFPQYLEIHNLLDETYGKNRVPLYIISPNKILLWGVITSRVFKIYSALNPVLLSSVFNQITKNEKQLLFLVYKQYSKIKLGHVKLWWYMYIITFIPILNMIFFYAKRVTYQNSLLYSFINLEKLNKVTIQDAIDATVTEETEAGISNISQDGISINGVRNLFFLWLSYFISRPHLQTQLYLLRQYNLLKDTIDLEQIKWGYNFYFKEKTYIWNKIITSILSIFLLIIIVLGIYSVTQPILISVPIAKCGKCDSSPVVKCGSGDIVPVEPILYPLNIKTTPNSANIRLINKSNMEKKELFLSEGYYSILASAKGYMSERVDIYLSENTTQNIVLKKLTKKQKNNKWFTSSLYGNDNNYAALREVTLYTFEDKLRVNIFNQFNTDCELTLDANKNPSFLKNCISLADTSFIYEMDLPLFCSKTKIEHVCNGKYTYTYSDSSSEEYTLTIARKLK